MSRDDTASDTDSTATSRRDVLRKTASVTAGGVAATTLAGAGSAEQQTIETVDGVRGRQVDRELATTGRELLGMLATNGLLADASPRELPTGQSQEIGGVAAKKEGTAAVRNSRGVLQYVTVTHVDDGVLTVTVEPGTERAYAHFEPDDRDATLVYDPGHGFDGVEQSDIGTSSHCSTSCNCTRILCDDGTGTYVEECETCCCTADCGCCCSTTYDCCG